VTEIPTVAVAGVPDPLPDEIAVLDVRELFEWERGHIEGALHIPMTDLPSRLDEVSGGQTLVVCKVGSRSAQVAAYLLEQGYNVVNLDGGLLDWSAAGRALVSETGQPPVVV
jgi:rhodanese-related sulfurtransferase